MESAFCRLILNEIRPPRYAVGTFMLSPLGVGNGRIHLFDGNSPLNTAGRYPLQRYLTGVVGGAKDLHDLMAHMPALHRLVPDSGRGDVTSPLWYSMARLRMKVVATHSSSVCPEHLITQWCDTSSRLEARPRSQVMNMVPSFMVDPD